MFSPKVLIQIFITLMLITTAWLPAKAQSEAESIVERWVESADDYSFVNISYGSIDHDSANNTTTVNNLKLIFNKDAANENDKIKSEENAIDGKKPDKFNFNFKYTFEFPIVKFDNLTFDGDYYSARLISSEQVLVNFALANSKSSDSTAGGIYKNLRIENIQWANLPEFIENDEKPVSNYFPLISALLDISFEKAGIDAVSMVQQTELPPLTMRTNYGRMEIGETSRGNFSSILVDSMKMEIENGDQSSQTPSSTSIEFGKMSATDYNYRTLLERFVANTSSSNSDNPFQTFMGHFSLENVQVNSKAGDFSLQNISADGIDVRSPDVDILAEADRFMIAANAGEDLKENKEIIKLVGSFYAMFRLDEFQITGMKFSSPKAGDGRMEVFRVAELSSDGIGEILLNGINFSDNKAIHFDLDHYSLSELSFPTFDSLVNLETATKSKNITEIMKAIPTLANMTIKGLKFMVPNKGEISVTENSISMADFIGPVPTDIQVLVKDFRMPTALMDRKPREMFLSMGYDQVDISYDINAIWEEATKVITLQSDVELAEGGLVSIDVAIGGIPRRIFENPQTVQSAAAFATLDKAEATFVDNSIVEKGLTLAGATQGVNADTMKAQVVGMLPIMLKVLDKPAFVDRLTAAVKNFLDNKGSITASAAPAAPVLILQLLGAGATAPGAVIDLLNVNVVSN
ncbi:MAG: hypothetical protein GY761_09575 [Hyphomicrobiales bacterium]|nr:hypothetical protein [Hyphomicrobiales bacterium]